MIDWKVKTEVMYKHNFCFKDEIIINIKENYKMNEISAMVQKKHKKESYI